MQREIKRNSVRQKNVIKSGSYRIILPDKSYLCQLSTINYQLMKYLYTALILAFLCQGGATAQEKMQEVKRPATATTSKASEPVKTNVIKERPLFSGASDKKATQSAQPVHRQNVEKVVSQETRQNYTKDRRTKVQQTQSVQKNQQTTEKSRNLVTKKGQKKK